MEKRMKNTNLPGSSFDLLSSMIFKDESINNTFSILVSYKKKKENISSGVPNSERK